MIYLTKSKFIFIISSISTLCVLFIMKQLLPINELILDNYTKTVGIDRASELIQKQEKWQWLEYAILPLIILIRTHITAFLLYIGSTFFNYKFTYKKCVNISFKGEGVILFSLFCKFIWLYFNRDLLTMEYIQLFSPLSLINLFNYNEIDQWASYILQTINLFELIYIFFLSYLIMKNFNVNFKKSLELVITTYGLGLIIWIMFITFLSLNLL